MKVSEVMSRSVTTVTEDTPLKEAGRLIFSLGIAGLPVLREGKLVGIVTEEDILAHMHPTMHEVAQDVHARNFDEMEANLVPLLEKPVKDIMNTTPFSIKGDVSILQAQSIMKLHGFSRLPIVDGRGNLIGIVSQGDIFRQLLRNEIPKLENDRYAGFIAQHYDQMVDWKKRFAYEFPALLKLLKKKRVQNVLDLGVWSGEYSVGLARKSVLNIVGLDHNPMMISIAESKRKKLPERVRKRLKFLLSDFSNVEQDVDKKFDAIISMGNAFPYIPENADKLLSGIRNVLREKGGILVLQVLNFEKVLKQKNRLLSFIIQDCTIHTGNQHLFMEFFDRGKDNMLLHHLVLFDYDGTNWIYKGLTTVKVSLLLKKDIEGLLKKHGFKKISFSGNMGEYQGEYGKLSFDEPFDPKNSDFLNIVAQR